MWKSHVLAFDYKLLKSKDRSCKCYLETRSGKHLLLMRTLICDDFAAIKQSITSTVEKCWFRNHLKPCLQVILVIFILLNLGSHCWFWREKDCSFFSECHAACFKLRQYITRQAQIVWLISSISIIFLVKSRIYFLSSSYLHPPPHGPVKSHYTGYFKFPTDNNLRCRDYQLKSRKNGDLKTNHTKSQLFKASGHDFSLDYIKLQRKEEKRSSYFSLNITHGDQKPEPTVKSLRCSALIPLALRVVILTENCQATVNHVPHTERQPELKNKNGKYFLWQFKSSNRR